MTAAVMGRLGEGSMRNRNNTRGMLRSFYRPWYARPFVWLLALVPTFVAARLALTPYAAHKVRARLATAPGAEVTFRALHVFTSPPVFVLDDVEARPRDAVGASPLRAERVEVHFSSWTDVFRRDPTVRVRVRAPVWNVDANESLRLSAFLAHLPPAKVELLTVENGSIVSSGARLQTALVDDVAAAVRGLSTTPRLGAGRPAEVEARADLLDGGRLSVRFTTDVWTGGSLSGAIDVRNLGLAQLERAVGLDGSAQQGGGAMDLTATFRVRDGAVEGSVDGVATSLRLGSTSAAVSERLAAATAGLVPGVMATSSETGRFRGAVTPPTVGDARAVLGVVRVVVGEGVGKVLALAMAEERAAEEEALASSNPSAAEPPSAAP